LIASLIGVIAQDVSLFAMSGTEVRSNPVVLGLQGMVLLIAIGLIFLARKAIGRGWIAAT
jgi:hypothetical protein